jgi:hypothetical protein
MMRLASLKFIVECEEPLNAEADVELASTCVATIQGIYEAIIVTN